MSVKSAYDFPLPGFWSDRAVAEQVCDINGTRYLLRQLDEYMLFRRADTNRLEHTFFVPYHITRDAAYSQKVFAEQIDRGENGRAALYACPQARDCNALLFFRQDGTGFFPDYDSANGYCAHEPRERVHFDWQEVAHKISFEADILTAQPPQMAALCHAVFTEQVWRRMKDPFIRYADLPDAPLEWECGSEAELTRITNCILHSLPDEWAELEAKTRPWGGETRFLLIVYQAQMAKNRGGPLPDLPKRIHTLCRLAFQYNTFVGHKWNYHRYTGRKRCKSYRAKPVELSCRVAPPSAHERAEALLTLWDWLEGKVTEKQRRVYCGVEE